VRYSVESWQPEFGSAFEDLDEDVGDAKIDPEVEVPLGSWRPIEPDSRWRTEEVRFIDGVRRIDARVWIERDGESVLGLCASCAAGVVRCDGKAELLDSALSRLLITVAPEGPIVTRHASYEPLAAADSRMETLMNAFAGGLSRLEVEVAGTVSASELTVIDGPLRGREQIDGAIGYIKSHRVAYLPSELKPVLGALGASERSPVFLVETNWSRYSWYLRLTDPKGHPWAGIVRCEAPPTLSKFQAIEVANRTGATLPRFASEPHKDGRAPQNLYPIKGLEALLRSRLGSSEILLRSLSLTADNA
jgi:hypothetical protein